MEKNLFVSVGIWEGLPSRMDIFPLRDRGLELTGESGFNFITFDILFPVFWRPELGAWAAASGLRNTGR